MTVVHFRALPPCSSWPLLPTLAWKHLNTSLLDNPSCHPPPPPLHEKSYHTKDVRDVLHTELLALGQPVLQESVHVHSQLLLFLFPKVCHMVLQVVHGDQAALCEPSALSFHPPHDACSQPVKRSRVTETPLHSFIQQTLTDCLMHATVSGLIYSSELDRISSIMKFVVVGETKTY